MAKRRAVKRSSSKNYVKLSYLQLAIAAVVLVLAAVFLVSKASHGKPNVLGVATNSYRDYTVNWVGGSNIRGYNIYYKPVGDHNWTYAVRGLPRQSTSYTISYLSKNKSYLYQVKGYDFSGKEFWWAPQGSIPASN